MATHAPMGGARCYPYRPAEFVDLFPNVVKDAITFARHPDPTRRTELASTVMVVKGGPGSGVTWLLHEIQRRLTGQTTAERPPKDILPFYWSFRASRPREDGWAYDPKRFSTDCLKMLYLAYNTRHSSSQILFNPKADLGAQIETLVRGASRDTRFVMLLDDLDHFPDKLYLYFIEDILLKFIQAARYPNRNFRVIIGLHEGVSLDKLQEATLIRTITVPEDLLNQQIHGLPESVMAQNSPDDIQTALTARHRYYQFNNPRINRFLIEDEINRRPTHHPPDCRSVVEHLLAEQPIGVGGVDFFYQRMMEDLWGRLKTVPNPIISDADRQKWSGVPAGHLVHPAVIDKSHYFIRQPANVHKLHEHLLALLRDCLEQTGGQPGGGV